MERHDKRQLYEDLQKKHPVFIYQGFTYTADQHSLKAEFTFELPGIHVFKPTFEIPAKKFIDTSRLEKAALDNLLFHIGMVELVSYWKATCSPAVIIRPYILEAAQVAWFKKLYFRGLGEFFYLNGLRPHPSHFVNIITEGKPLPAPFSTGNEDDYLVPVGGGKDSVVTLELLRQKHRVRPLIVNPRGATLETANAAGFGKDDILEINRTIHPQLLRLNEEGYLNGHTPFSALIAFASLLAAGISGHRNIALSNEASANESTIAGTGINHQYSKTYEFEKDFREYAATYITPDISYFSFLRPLHEIQIARIFADFTQYHGIFKSCNAGSKNDSWCGKCAKCLFTFIILSPFLGSGEMNKIFGRDLFEDQGLKGLFDELAGVADSKPFDCIGTVDEVNLALCMILKKSSARPLPYLLQRYENSSQYVKYSGEYPASLLKSMKKKHFLSNELLKLIKEHL